MVRPPGPGEDPAARRTDGLDVLLQIPQEDRLRDDGVEAGTHGRENVEDRAIDRIGLAASIRDPGGRPAVEEQLSGRGAFESAENDRAAVYLDCLGCSTRRFDPPMGSGLDTHSRAGLPTRSACDK
jgi:hypothetical protein